MADLMRFWSNITRKLDVGDYQEPTVPGPIADETQLTWFSGYPYAGYAVRNDIPTLTDSQAVYVNSVTGLDTNPGTQASPVKTLTKAMTLVTPTKNVLVISGTFYERIEIAETNNFFIVAKPNEIATIAAPDGLLFVTGSGFSTNADFASVNTTSNLVQVGKGDYLVDTTSKALRFYAPNLVAGGKRIYSENGKNAVDLGNDLPAATYLRSLVHAYHNVNNNQYLLGLFPYDAYYFSGTHAGLGGYPTPPGGWLSTYYPFDLFTNPKLDITNGNGVFPYTFTVVPPSSDAHSYIIDIARNYRHDVKLMAVTVKYIQGDNVIIPDPPNPDFVIDWLSVATLQETRIQFWQYNGVNGSWTLFDEVIDNDFLLYGLASGQALHGLTARGKLLAAGDCYFFIKDDGLGLLPAEAKTFRKILISRRDSLFSQENASTSLPRLYDIVFYKDMYYAATADGIYSSFDGINDRTLLWSPVQLATGTYIPCSLAIINDVLFCNNYWDNQGGTLILNDILVYSYDGLQFYELVAGSGVNGILANVRNNICIFRGQITSTVQPAMRAWQEALINVVNDTQTTASSCLCLQNIQFSGKTAQGLIKAGSAVNRSVNFLPSGWNVGIFLGHCGLSHFAGAAIGNTIPIALDCTINDCYRGFDSYDDGIPFAGSYDEKSYNTAWEPAANFVIMYTIFHTITKEAIKYAFPIVDIGPSGFALQALEPKIVHNTFNSCGLAIDHADYRMDAGLPGYNILSNSRLDVSNNLIHRCPIAIKQNFALIRLTDNLLTGAIVGSLESGSIHIIGPLVLPKYQDEATGNFRLLWAGYDHNHSGIIPQFNSHGAGLAGSPPAFDLTDTAGSDMGAYHRQNNLDVEYRLDYEQVLLESPPATEWVLRSLHGNQIDGLVAHHTFSEAEYNVFTLNYSESGYSHENNRTAHALRQLRVSKTPLWWFPFHLPMPPIEIETGRKFNDVGSLDQLIYTVENNVFTTASSFLWKIINPTSQHYFVYNNSQAEREVLSGQLQAPTSGLGFKPDFDWFLGMWAQVKRIDGDGFYQYTAGTVVEYKADTNTILIDIPEGAIADQPDYDIFFTHGFWVGLVSFYKKYPENPPPFNFDYSTTALRNAYLDGLHDEYIDLYLYTGHHEESEPFGIYDDFVITLTPTTEMISFIISALSGTITPTPTLDRTWFPLNPPSDYRASFRLQSLRYRQPDHPSRLELYRAYPIHPNNPLWRFKTIMRQIYDGLPNSTAESDFFKYWFDAQFHAVIDSLIVYPNRGDIQSHNANNGHQDVWFSHGSEWRDHYYQSGVPKQLPAVWSGQQLELVQSHEHRGLLPFEGSPYAYH